MKEALELRAIREILSKPEPTPDFSRIFTNFSLGCNHAVIEWNLSDNDAIIKNIWGDFKNLTSYNPEKCIGLSIKNFLEDKEKISDIISHALQNGFVAKKTAIYTTSGDIKYVSGILYKHDNKTLIEFLFNAIGIEL